MGDISIPNVLSNADSILNLVTLFQKILDPSERMKIAEDVASFHKLNETEAAKAQEARDLIKRHTEVLNENINVSQKNELDKKDFQVEMENERKILAEKKREFAESLQKFKEDKEEILNISATNAAKESELQSAQSHHSENVEALKKEWELLEQRKKELDEYNKKVIELDASTKAKVEKLKQLNF